MVMGVLRSSVIKMAYIAGMRESGSLASVLVNGVTNYVSMVVRTHKEAVVLK